MSSKQSDEDCNCSKTPSDIRDSIILQIGIDQNGSVGINFIINDDELVSPDKLAGALTALCTDQLTPYIVKALTKLAVDCNLGVYASQVIEEWMQYRDDPPVISPSKVLSSWQMSEQNQ
jgi:hypothetical protein